MNPAVVLLFMFLGLIAGIVVLQLMSKFGERIPYTVVIFLLGLCLAATAVSSGGAWTDSIIAWENIDADLMLFVFLPPLIFGEAMGLNWYHVKGGFVQSLLLAGPGVVVGALLMGVITKYILPYGWSWELSMLFGSILSATDPVAVVALLKSAGASPKLTILIVGESLMNDGTAMVMFTLFFNMLSGEVYTFPKVVAFFASAAVGSCALGIIVGFATLLWLRSASRALSEADEFIQISITICCAYIVFFLAQYFLEVSGVLACCGAGLVLAMLAPPVILNHVTMHSVWSMIEWIGNTLIFLLAGLIIGRRVLQNVTAVDWFYVVLLYVILMLIRALIIVLLYPWLSTTGHKCTVAEAVFMAWAGLRGALGMALALIVNNTDSLDISESESSRLLFYVGGIAALTLIINASLAKRALEALGLLGNETLEKALVTNQIKRRLRKKLNRLVDELKGQLTSEEIEEVRQSCSLLRYSELPRTSELRRSKSLSAGRSPGRAGVVSSILNSFRDSEARGNPRTESGVSRSEARRMKSVSELNRMLSLSIAASRTGQPSTNCRLVAYVRTVFLEIVRVKYWKLIEAGNLPRLSHSAQYLLYSLDVGIDKCSDAAGAQDWAAIEAEITEPPLYLQSLLLLERLLPRGCSSPVSRLVGRLEARKDKRAVYMLTSFIEAHQHAQQKIHSFIGVLDEDENPTPLDPGHAEADMQCCEERQVVAESCAAVEQASALLAQMQSETVSAIRAKQFARVVLSKQVELVNTMVDEGLLSHKNAAVFFDEIASDTSEIERQRNRMYREQAKQSASRRTAFRFAPSLQHIQEDSLLGRPDQDLTELLMDMDDRGSGAQ